MSSPKNSRILRPMIAVMFSLLFIAAFPLIGSGDEVVNVSNPDTRANGPVVNNSVIDIRLNEDFDEIVDQYFNGTGYGNDDLFFDPNYDWDEVDYPHKPFEVVYPVGYDVENTPIKVYVDRDAAATNFGKVTITCNGKYGANWNTIIYGQDWFVVTIIARNKTGSSEAQVRFQVSNVNDGPVIIDNERDFFAIKMSEDGEYTGINGDHDPPNLIFGDNKDPFDVVSFSYEAMNDNAKNITVELEEDGSSIKFIPKENWSCPYLPNNQRLKGDNRGDYLDVFAFFRINCSDQDGMYIPKKDQKFFVYVKPENDEPMMTPINEVRVDEDTLLSMQFEASDLDEEWDQGVRFSTNITTSIYESTLEQIEFQDEYYWDRDEGKLEFMTSNDLVGEYEVEAYVRDYSTESGRTDYQNTPYKIYQNFTLFIDNVNDDPIARIDQPFSTFEYNTSSLIEFNAQRSIDIDIQHGDVLNYTWTKNGEIFGYGPVFHKVIPDEGTFNITVNVTDSVGISSVKSVNINVRKARVPGAIFDNADMDRAYNDNSTAVVISRTTDVINLFNGGEYSLDVKSVTSERNGALFTIRVMFEEELDFLFTEEITQEPKLDLYFLTPDFQEQQITINPQDALNYVFPVPFSNERYTRIEYDLRGPSATHPPSIVPLDTVRKLDGGMGIEIKLTVVWMDDLGIKPDFELYVVGTMKTTIKDANGQTLEVLNSWDSSGSNTKLPVITDAKDVETGNGESDIPWLLIVVISIILILFIAAMIVVAILVTRKKEEEPEPLPPAQPQQSIEEMVFGDQQQLEPAPQYPDAAQLYGQTPEATGGNLPPAQEPIQQSVDQQVQQPAAQPVQQPAPAAQAPQVGAVDQAQS